MLSDLREVTVMMRDEPQPGKILVLVPYQAQKRRLEAELRRDPPALPVDVSTVDSAQGSEADFVFFGLVKTAVGHSANWQHWEFDGGIIYYWPIYNMACHHE